MHRFLNDESNYEEAEIKSDFKLFENNREVFNFKNRSEFVSEFHKIEDQIVDSEQKLSKILREEKDRIFRDLDGSTKKVKLGFSLETILKAVFGIDECRTIMREKRRKGNRAQIISE